MSHVLRPCTGSAGSGAMLFLLPFLWANLAHGASFDCKKARSDREKNVCQSGELSGLDEEMTALYQQAMAVAPQPDLLRRDQVLWNSIVDARGRDPAALVIQYRERIRTLMLRRDLPNQDYHDEASGHFSDRRPIMVYDPEAKICPWEENNGYCFVTTQQDIKIITVDASRGRLTVSLVFDHYHNCFFDGVGHWDKGRLKMETREAESDLGDGVCHLQALPTPGSVQLQADEGCRVYCGANVGMNGTTLPRRKYKK